MFDNHMHMLMIENINSTCLISIKTNSNMFCPSMQPCFILVDGFATVHGGFATSFCSEEQPQFDNRQCHLRRNRKSRSPNDSLQAFALRRGVRILASVLLSKQQESHDGSTDIRKSQQLQIYEEYYNKPPEPTSMQKAMSTIKRILPKTVGRRRGARARTRNSISSSNSSSESQSDEYSTSSSRDKDEDFEPEVGIMDSPEADGVEAVLLTPRAFTPSPGPGQPSRP
jgi:hypothetical protein